MLDNEEIYLEIDGKNFINWKNFTVSRSIDNFCGSMTANLKISSSDYAQKIYNVLAEDEPIKVFIGEDQIFEGWIFTREREVTAESTNVTITARDKTADLVDCTLAFKNYEFTNISLKRMCEIICNHYGIFADITLNEKETFQRIHIDETETAFSVINRICKDRGYIPTTNRFGDLSIRDLKEEVLYQTGDFLEYGRNILEISESVDLTDIYSTIKIIGTQQKTEKKDSSQDPWAMFANTEKDVDEEEPNVKNPSFTIANKDFKRYRHIALQSESTHQKDTLRKKALWERRIRDGRSKKYTVKINGYKENIIATRKPLWNIFTKTRLKVPIWDIDDIFIIDSVEYTQGDLGRITTLTLRDPNTYAVDVKNDIPDKQFLFPEKKEKKTEEDDLSRIISSLNRRGKEE